MKYTITRLNHRKLSIAEEIHEISLQAYAEEAQRLACEAFPPLSETVADILQSRENFFGAMVEGKLLGLVGICDIAGNLTITRLVVRAAFFRRGVGTTLLTWLLKQHTKLNVATALENLPAVRCYEKLGFQITSTRTDDFTGLTLVEFTCNSNLA